MLFHIYVVWFSQEETQETENRKGLLVSSILQFLNNVIIIKTKVLFRQSYVTLHDFGNVVSYIRSLI
jgi:hypothetical protein